MDPKRSTPTPPLQSPPVWHNIILISVNFAMFLTLWNNTLNCSEHFGGIAVDGVEFITIDRTSLGVVPEWMSYGRHLDMTS